MNDYKTCFSKHKQKHTLCKKEACRHWIDCHESNNCVLIEAQKGPKTLQEVGHIFGITRMRVCQIEKKIIQKLRNENIF